MKSPMNKLSGLQKAKPNIILDTLQKDVPQMIVFLLDISGSMHGSDYYPTRMDGGKAAIKEMAKEVLSKDPNARLAMISFDTYPHFISDWTADINEFCVAVDSICFGGGTTIRAGLNGALKQFGGLSATILRIISRKISTHTKRIVLLSDGEDYSGICTAMGLKKSGVVIDCVGIGGSPSYINEPHLKKIASKVDGKVRYKFIGDSESLISYYRDELSCYLQKTPCSASTIKQTIEKG